MRAPASRSPATTGTTRASSSSSGTGSDPGRVDSPPMSRMPAPSPAIARPCWIARRASSHSPPSENESGVTLTTPMTVNGSIGADNAAMLRAAEPERDGAACAAVYAPYVEGSIVSFEEVAPDGAEMTRRIAATTREFPWLVAERDGEVAGYAYGSRHRDRAAYRWAADVAVYLDARHHGRGIGRALLTELVSQLRDQGLRWACAGIALPNDASVGLHESLGFELVGIYREIGFKAGAWHDVGWWALDMAPGGAAPDGA